MPLLDFDPQQKGSFVSGSRCLCQISSKLVKNCDRESADRQTHTQTHRDDRGDLIICPMLCYSNGTDNKTAELSQRSLHDAPNIWVPWKVLRVLNTHPATFPEICNGLLFRSILRMCVQKLKFVTLPVPEIIGGTQKIWAVPVYAHAPFSIYFLIGFCLHRASEYTCQIWRS